MFEFYLKKIRYLEYLIAIFLKQLGLNWQLSQNTGSLFGNMLNLKKGTGNEHGCNSATKSPSPTHTSNRLSLPRLLSRTEKKLCKTKVSSTACGKEGRKEW